MSVDQQAGEAVVLDEHRQPQPVLSIRGTAPVARLAEVQGERLRDLWQSLRSQGLMPAGSPFVRYHSFDETETDVEVGVAVEEGAAAGGNVAASALPGGHAITTWHVGAHDGLGAAYERLAGWLKENDREAAGPAWEIYWWIDPTREPDPSSWPPPTEWRTELVQPIR